MERVMVFIDGSNLYKEVKKAFGENYGLRMDRFLEILVRNSEYRVIQTYYYNVRLIQSYDPVSYAKQRRFLSRLAQIPTFEFRPGRLVKRPVNYKCPKCKTEVNPPACTKCGLPLPNETFIEKGVDVFLATDMVSKAFDNLYDTAILVSRDGDFVPAVKEVRRLHKKVINVDVPRLDGKPSFLSQICDQFVPLTKEFLKEALILSS